MLSMTSFHESRFQEDVYKLQVRSGYPHLLLNSGYTGIRIVSCPSGESLKLIAFPESIESFTLDTWLVSPDGQQSYLFSRDETFALGVDLQTKTVRKIGLSPHMAPPSGLCWFTPELRVWDQHKQEWRLENDRFMPVGNERHGKEDDAVTRRFRNALGGLAGFTVLKMSPGGQGFYVLGEDGALIGHIPIVGDSLLVPQDGNAIDVAHHGNDLFVCFENEIIQHEGGSSRTALTAKSDEFFLAIQVLEAEGQSYLCVLASTQDQTTSILRPYRLFSQP
jgi:hypothetical protein